MGNNIKYIIYFNHRIPSKFRPIPYRLTNSYAQNLQSYIYTDNIATCFKARVSVNITS
jgi:hypothetical protein